MQPIKRPLFICSAIEQCTEKTDCCVHKTPHIKDERCIVRGCRYAPGVEQIDCDLHDPEHPRVPIPAPVITKTVEETMKEKIAASEAALKSLKEETVKYVPGPVTVVTKDLIENAPPVPERVPIEEVHVTELQGSPQLIEAIKQTIEITEQATQEIDIKKSVSNSEHPGCDYPTPCTDCPKEGDPSCVRETVNNEQNIKEAVKKQVQRKGSKKKSGVS